MVNLLLHATELHPDLPIFPIESTSTPKKSPAGNTPRSLFAGVSAGGLFHRAEANPTGTLNFIRKIPANAKKSTLAKARSGTGSLQSKTAAQANALAAGHQVYDEEESSFTRLWPRPGKGMYSRLPPEADDDRGLTDDNDHAAFSVIIFNEKGSTSRSYSKLSYNPETFSHDSKDLFGHVSVIASLINLLTHTRTEKIEENGVKV